MKTEFSVVMCRVFNYYSNNWFALMPPFTHMDCCCIIYSVLFDTGVFAHTHTHTVKTE